MTVTVSIPIPERINNKVQGDFYPLQRQELNVNVTAEEV
jgi:hypothetical protein